MITQDRPSHKDDFLFRNYINFLVSTMLGLQREFKVS